MDTKRPKTKEDLRRLAEKALGRAIPEDVWIMLESKGVVLQALKDFWQRRDSALEDFLDAVRPDLELYRRVQESRRQGRREKQLEGPEGDLTEYEVERAKAVAEHLAKYLSARKEIRNFRKRYLEANSFPLKRSIPLSAPQQSVMLTALIFVAMVSHLLIIKQRWSKRGWRQNKGNCITSSRIVQNRIMRPSSNRLRSASLVMIGISWIG